MASSRPPISNPYAKKRKAPSGSAAPVLASTQFRQSASQNVVPNRQGHALGSSLNSTRVGLAPLDVGGNSTFSQVFGSVDETVHFQKEMEALTTSLGSKEHEERIQQRAMDRQEQQQQQKEDQKLSDRDHHVMLQPHVLYVSERQRGNGLLKHIRNVPFAYSKMVPDYIMSSTSCALFLSMKYHQLYPNYIHRRLGALKTDFTLRVLLVLVDIDDNANILLFLNKLAATQNLTLILAWTEEEAARYLETYKALHGKDASSIQKREATNYIDQVADFLTACKPLNKTDAGQLVTHFSQVKSVLAASKDELALCPGIGPIKVQKLWDAFHKPFSKKAAAERRLKQEAEELEQDLLQEEEEQQKKPRNLKHPPPANNPVQDRQESTIERLKEKNVVNKDSPQHPTPSKTDEASSSMKTSFSVTVPASGVNEKREDNTTTSMPPAPCGSERRKPQKQKIAKVSLSSFVGKVEKTNQVMDGVQPSSSSPSDIDAAVSGHMVIGTAYSRRNSKSGPAPPPPAYTQASKVVTTAAAEHSAVAGTRLSAPTDKESTMTNSPANQRPGDD